MKKIFVLLSLFFVLASGVSANSNIAPDYLAKKGIIQASFDNVAGYKLDNNITRREMLKVMMNISGKSLDSTCSGKFSDVPASDWGCKYAESALKSGFIASNSKFRPNDKVTQIEALKMIMQSKGLEKGEGSDWREAYVNKAKSEKLIADNISYDKHATRKFIFEIAARSFKDSGMPEFGQTSTKTKEPASMENFPEDIGLLIDEILRASEEEIKKS